MRNNYDEFIKGKIKRVDPCGFNPPLPMHESLFNWQRPLVKLAIKKGRFALFEDCGMGKAIQQLEWARQVHKQAGKPVLILAPVAVADQTAEVEAPKFGFEVKRVWKADEVVNGINITNYERLHLFDDVEFAGVVLDESSILKSFDGKMRRQLTDRFAGTPYRLCCSATPAPNDFTELGQHAEFLGICTPAQMLAMYFVNDTYDTGTWRLKKHAERTFWQWVSSWAACLSKPSDIGFSDEGFTLPPLNIESVLVDVDEIGEVDSGEMFRNSNLSATTMNAEMRRTLKQRCAKIMSLICGNQNTPNQGESNITQTRKNENAESAKDGTANPTSDICDSIMQLTNPDGMSDSQTITPERPKISSGEKSMRATPSLGRPSKSKSRNGLKSEETKNASELLNTESQSTNSTRCFPTSAENAQYAAFQTQATRGFSPTSTTATKPIKSEESFAQVAISESANSETAPNCCVSPPITLNERWAIWTNLNDEQDEIERLFGGIASSVRGSDTEAEKTKGIHNWLDGKNTVLVSKGSILGMGMNFQCCCNVIIFPKYSFEEFYQIIRRFWRYGQTKPVNVFIVLPKTATAILDTLKRKQVQHDTMRELTEFTRENLTSNKKTIINMNTNIITKEAANWTMYNADCVRAIREKIADESIGFSIFSPPFADLFTYSADVQDMGNCNGLDEFMAQFNFLVDELLRVTIPGRECAVHCCDLLATKWKDGAIEFKDFSGAIKTAFRSRGWLLHSCITIWKSPVTEMQRTKAHGLLYKTLRKDSSSSRVGAPDYLLVFRKRGENPKPIEHTPESFPLDLWQEVASPVWMTVNQSRVLNGEIARENSDERHICPLQLDVIERALMMWSAPDDLVLSPFAGIGSEGVSAIKMGRQFIGCELKESYFNLACANLENVSIEMRSSMFA